MTRFVRTLFTTSGDYLHYNGRFVARFKHRGPFNKTQFMKELIANHTVKDYFTKMEQGVAPLVILRDANEDWYYGILEAYYGRPIARLIEV